MTLTEFLLARIAEDEAVAQSAVEHDWPRSIDDRWVEGAGTPSNVAYFAQVEHVERFTPARVLAECEAKRRIVEMYEKGKPAAETLDALSKSPQGSPDIDLAYAVAQAAMVAVEAVLKLHATAYADHQDYDESWRP